MDNNILILGGNVYSIPEKGRKSITSIPGWAVAYNEEQAHDKTARRYMQSPTAFRCGTIRANALSAIPWQIVKPKGDERAPVPDTEVEQVLREVNPIMNWVDLIRATETDMVIHGQAFWLKIGKKGPITNLKRLNPAIMKVDADSSGIKAFIQKGGKGRKEIQFPVEEIVYFHTYHPQNDLGGLSPLDICASSIDVEIKSHQYIDSFFDNYCMPAVMLTSEKSIDEGEAKRIKKWYQRMFGGAEDKHKIAVSGGGLKVEQLGYPVKDLALKEVRAEARRDICAALGVPPAIAGAWEAANFASSKEQRESLYEDTIIPRAQYYAGVLNADLISQFDDGALEFEWKFDELDIMQPDRLQEAQRAALLANAGVVEMVPLAMELGYKKEDAGEGPTQRRIIGENAGIDNNQGKSNFALDMDKWERKSLNAYAKKENAQVDFESTNIPDRVYLGIHNDLGKAKNKDDIRDTFAPYKELGV